MSSKRECESLVRRQERLPVVSCLEADAARTVGLSCCSVERENSCRDKYKIVFRDSPMRGLADQETLFVHDFWRFVVALAL